MTSAKVTSKSEQAYAHLRAQITEQTLMPGHRLVLRSIADELGVSVVPVREAIRRLEAEGLVTFEHHVGARVAMRDDRRYLQVMQLLAVTEGAATALAASSLGPAEVAEARGVNEELRQQLARFDATGFTALNRAFHTVLFSRCPNDVLRDSVFDLWDRLDHLRTSTFSFVPDRSPQSVAEHEQLLKLIEQSAPLPEVEQAARAHRTKTLEAYLAQRSPRPGDYIRI